MDQTDKNKIIRHITEFENINVTETHELCGNVANIRAGDHVAGIVEPMLAKEGYKCSSTDSRLDFGAELIAHRAAGNRGCESTIAVMQSFNAGNELFDVDLIYDSAYYVGHLGVHKVLVVVNTEFTEKARESAKIIGADKLDLYSPPSLREWLSGFDIDDETRMMGEFWKDTARKVARRMAAHNGKWSELEWREIERQIAAMLEGHGFKVTLTACSQDGGKDVIAEFLVQGKRKSYIIEAKHWKTKGVDKDSVKHFAEIAINEKRDGAIILATGGFAGNAFELLTEYERKVLRIAGEEKLCSLCDSFEKLQGGLYTRSQPLQEIIECDTQRLDHELIVMAS